MRVAWLHGAVAAWLVVGSRVLTGIRPDLAGALDDASLVALYAGLQAMVSRISRSAIRVGIGWALAALLVAAVFTNQVFFSFFHTYLSVASVQLAGIAADASSSITDLLSPANLLALLAVPLAAQLVVARRAVGTASRDAGMALFFAGLVLAGLGSALRDPVFLFAQHNPTLSLVRDVGARALQGLGLGDAPDPASRQDLLALIGREGWKDYEPSGGRGHPVWQRPRPGSEAGPSPTAPNVVIVLMESMRGLEMRGDYRNVPVTPALNALESEALVFPNFYANGMTTVDGEFSILCSALPVVNEAPVYIRQPDLDIRCLPEILRDHGYETHWISAYRSTYANKRIFLSRHGIDAIHDEQSMDRAKARHPDVGWGLGDLDSFDQALEKMDGFGEPFFAEIMTLSNHHPFDHDYGIDFPEALARVPGNEHYRNYLRGMYYTDHAVGRFLEAAREKPWFSRTLFVILGDHAVRAFPEAPDGGRLGPVLESEIYFRNRLILYGPGLVSPGRSEVVGSQIDVAPTLLDLLGIRTPNAFLGVSLLADLDTSRRYALMNIGHVFNIRSGDQYCYSVGYSCFEGVFPRCPRGVEPTSLGHTCFELEGDLLDAGAANTVRSLDALERARTLERAQRIMDLNRRLIAENRFGPPDSPSPRRRAAANSGPGAEAPKDPGPGAGTPSTRGLP